jgi:hypothetical protein
LGKFDSSKTRVQPVFEALYWQDTTGEMWLSRLLQLAERSMGPEAVAITPDLGQLVAPPQFEFAAHPPRAYLEWLINHPEELTDPPEAEWKKWHARTQEKRRALLAGNRAVRAEAIAELEKRRRLPQRAWWRLEGVTRVDCGLLTPSAVIFVEGKRTEMGPSKKVTWYEKRNQVLRVLDCASSFARRTDRQHYFVILVVERDLVEQDPVRRSEIQAVTSAEAVRGSLPHLTTEHRTEMLSHYLGMTTWQTIVESFDLERDLLLR